MMEIILGVEAKSIRAAAMRKLMLTWLPWLLTLLVLQVDSVTQPNIVMMVADDLGSLEQI